MAKYVRVKGAEVRAFRGDTLGRLTDRIRFGSVKVSGYSRILIHVGSNDISNLVRSSEVHYMCAQDMLRRYKALRSIIRRRNSGAVLIFSAILPRQKQFHLFKPYIIGMNFAIEKWCAKSRGASVFIPAYKPFLAHGKPKPELFACDGLHLTGAGVEVLEGCMQQALSTGYLVRRVNTQRTARLSKLSY